MFSFTVKTIGKEQTRKHVSVRARWQSCMSSGRPSFWGPRRKSVDLTWLRVPDDYRSFEPIPIFFPAAYPAAQLHAKIAESDSSRLLDKYRRHRARSWISKRSRGAAPCWRTWRMFRTLCENFVKLVQIRRTARELQEQFANMSSTFSTILVKYSEI